MASPPAAMRCFKRVRDNQAALLFSVETDPNIMFERETGFPASPPGFGVWATAPDIDAMNPPLDTDGLEVWGGDNNDDSDRYSLAGDPPFRRLGKDRGLGVYSACRTQHSAHADHRLGGRDGHAVRRTWRRRTLLEPARRTDGRRRHHDVRPASALSASGRSICAFSQPGGPLLPTFDGGEIFEYDDPAPPTKFLNHGGHLWDTLFDVRGTFKLHQ